MCSRICLPNPNIPLTHALTTRLIYLERAEQEPELPKVSALPRRLMEAAVAFRRSCDFPDRGAPEPPRSRNTCAPSGASVCQTRLPGRPLSLDLPIHSA